MRTVTNDIVQALTKKVYTTREAEQIARILLCHFGNLTTAQLLSSTFLQLSPEAKSGLQNAIRRLLLQEPLQYVLGEGQFYGLTFYTNPAALIPRPETEELVDVILKDHPNDGGSVLDIGTGSGCIAISLAHARRFDRVTGWDVSAEALLLARKNDLKHKTNVEFKEIDILTCPVDIYRSKFDIIVSNPPYVRRSERHNMCANVLDFEPHLALFVDDNDPLLFYRAIAAFAREALTIGGTLYFEINSQLGEETRQAVVQEGFAFVDLMKDIHGKDRMIRAKRLT